MDELIQLEPCRSRVREAAARSPLTSAARELKHLQLRAAQGHPVVRAMADAVRRLRAAREGAEVRALRAAIADGNVLPMRRER